MNGMSSVNCEMYKYCEAGVEAVRARVATSFSVHLSMLVRVGLFPTRKPPFINTHDLKFSLIHSS